METATAVLPHLDGVLKNMRERMASGKSFREARTGALNELRIPSGEWSEYCSAIGKIMGHGGGKVAANRAEKRRRQGEIRLPYAD